MKSILHLYRYRNFNYVTVSIMNCIDMVISLRLSIKVCEQVVVVWKRIYHNVLRNVDIKSRVSRTSICI